MRDTQKCNRIPAYAIIATNRDRKSFAKIRMGVVRE